jgi:hypothetical protein
VTLFEFLSRQINQAETEQRQKAVVEARSQRDEDALVEDLGPAGSVSGLSS